MKNLFSQWEGEKKSMRLILFPRDFFKASSMRIGIFLRNRLGNVAIEKNHFSDWSEEETSIRCDNKCFSSLCRPFSHLPSTLLPSTFLYPPQFPFFSVFLYPPHSTLSLPLSHLLTRSFFLLIPVPNFLCIRMKSGYPAYPASYSFCWEVTLVKFSYIEMTIIRVCLKQRLREASGSTILGNDCSSRCESFLTRHNIPKLSDTLVTPHRSRKSH